MELSIVIPVYQEEKALPELIPILLATVNRLGLETEIIFINDGSRDQTGKVLEEYASLDSRICVIEFSRNFGHQAAVTAGLDIAAGEAVVVMDADLQDPPELLIPMLELYHQGYDVVSPQRSDRLGESWFKRSSASFFYWLMKSVIDPRLTVQVGDFRLYSQRAVIVLRSMREQHRFLRGMVAWTGLKEICLPFQRASRVAGETKYPLRKMLRFAWTAISSSSALPLRMTFLLGLFFCLAGMGYLGYILYVTFITESTVPGWSSLASLQILSSGAILLAIGLLGDYLARVYEESKGRPLYVISHSRNIPGPRRLDRAIWLPAKTNVPEFSASLELVGEHH